MTALRRLLVAAALSAVVLGGRTAHAQAQGRVDVEKARAAYLARNYAEAEERLKALVDEKTGLKDPALLSQARMYLGAVLIAQGRPAVEVFEKLILNDASFEPDPLSFPTNVLNEFYDVRGRLEEKIRQNAQELARRQAAERAAEEEARRKQEAWLATIKQMAQEEKITVKNHRLVAFLPFGVGQFQNGETLLGWTFLVSESALVIATAVTVPMYTYARGRADEEQSGGDINRTAQLYQDRADNIRTANLGFAGAFAAIAITGIVQANLAYVPEKVETKRRDLPVVSKLHVTPLLSPAFVGLQSTF